MRVRQLAAQQVLTLEPLHADVVHRDVRVKDLQRDASLLPRVESLVHAARAAVGDATEDAVPTLADRPSDPLVLLVGGRRHIGRRREPRSVNRAEPTVVGEESVAGRTCFQAVSCVT